MNAPAGDRRPVNTASWPESLGSGESLESSSRARPGKNTRAGTSRVRCAGCQALVVSDAVDVAGLCDSCTTQRVLFGVRPVKRRRFTTTSRYPTGAGTGRSRKSTPKLGAKLGRSAGGGRRDRR